VGGKDALDDQELVRAFRAALLREEDFGHAAGPEAAHDLEVSELGRLLGHAVSGACCRRRATRRACRARAEG
jgi:hypothetical protein